VLWGVAFPDLVILADHDIRKIVPGDQPMSERVPIHNRLARVATHELGHQLFWMLDYDHALGFDDMFHSKWSQCALSYYHDERVPYFHPDLWKEVERDGLGISFWDWEKTFSWVKFSDGYNSKSPVLIADHPDGSAKVYTVSELAELLKKIYGS
jgi:hypothetical protein